MNAKIISLIPGRIRLKIEALSYNENMKYFLIKSFKHCPGIIMVSPNKFTGNMIVYFNVQLVDSSEILNRISLINIYSIPTTNNKCRCTINKNSINKYYSKIYSNEIAISRRLLTFSVITSGFVLLSSFNLEIILSILVLGFPGILFLIRRAIYKIVQNNLKYNEFDFTDPNLMYKLSEVDHLLIEDLILNPSNYHGIVKDLDELPNSTSQNLIKRLRNIGLIDITMISSQNDNTNSYISYLYGIKKIELDNIACYDNDEGIAVAIIRSNELNELSKRGIIVFEGYKELKPEVDDFTILFRLDKINEIPYVIETSQYCSKLAIRSENIAVSVSMLGIFLSLTEVITPLPSIALYLMNYVINIIYLKNRLSQYEKEQAQFYIEG